MLVRHFAGFARFLQLYDASAAQQVVVEVGEVRRGDERLDVARDERHQRAAARGVQLAHHVVQQQHRLLAQNVLDQRGLGQLERQHHRTLLPLAAEQGGVLAVDEELDAVGMRAHERPLSHALLAAAARKRIRQRLARLVAPERARGERKGIVLFPRRDEARVQPLMPVGDLSVVRRHRSRQLLEQRGAVARKLRAARDQRLVHRPHQRSRRLVLQQAVLVAQHLLVIAPDEVVVGRQLRAQRVQRGAAHRHGPFRQLQVVGRERHGRYEALQVGCALGLPVQQVLLLALGHLYRQLKLTAAVGDVGRQAREGSPGAHQLVDGRMSKRRLRRQQAYSLDDVRLPRGVRSHEHRERTDAVEIERLVAAEVQKRDMGDGQIHDMPRASLRDAHGHDEVQEVLALVRLEDAGLHG